MSGYRAVFAGLALALQPGLAIAQPDLSRYCAEIYARPEVGEFAELRIDDPESERSGALRFAVVGTEDRDGEELYWFEITTTGGVVDPGSAVIAQILVSRYPFDSEDIRGYVLKLPGRRAMRVPKPMIEQMSELTADTRIGWEEACRASRDLGTEQVEVPAGTFRVRHLRTAGEQGELWLSPEVPFGIVKFTDPKGGMMELVRHGSGASSSITEEPIELEVPSTQPDSL